MANADLADFKEYTNIANVEDDSSIYVNCNAAANGFHANGTCTINHSPKSTRSNDNRKTNNENTSLDSDSAVHKKHLENSDDTDSMHLTGGRELLEESGTETSRASLYTFSDDSQTTLTSGKQPFNMASSVISLSNGSGTAKARAAKSPYSSPSANTIHEEDISIPNDSNISSFTCDQMANFLRCFNVDKKIISHLYRKNVDGKRFSRLRDSELESLGMKNPVIIFFRDKSSAKHSKKKQFWVL